MKNYFLPNKKNNFHPHIFKLQNLLLVLVVGSLVFCLSLIGNTLMHSGILASVQSAFLVDLTNQERAERLVPTLTVNPVLVEAAQMKADDMAQKGYFEHVSPTGENPWYWFEKAGYVYKYAGENLAVNFTESQDVHHAWLASPTHRKNIIDSRFTEIGIATSDGFYKGKKATFVVQMFGKPQTKNFPIIQKQDTAIKTSSNISTTTQNTQKSRPQVRGAETENTQALPISEEIVFTKETNTLERIAVSPLSVGKIILLSIISILLLTLFFRLVIEFRLKHTRRVVLLMLLILVLSLFVFVQKKFLFEKNVISSQGEQQSQ